VDDIPIVIGTRRPRTRDEFVIMVLRTAQHDDTGSRYSAWYTRDLKTDPAVAAVTGTVRVGLTSRPGLRGSGIAARYADADIGRCADDGGGGGLDTLETTFINTRRNACT